MKLLPTGVRKCNDREPERTLENGGLKAIEVKSMTARTRRQEEKDDHQTPKKKKLQRVKRPRKQGITDRRVKKKLRIKTRSTENTRHTGKRQKVAVKVESKRGQKAGKKDTNIKQMRKGDGLEAKTERTPKRKNALNLITGKKKLSITNRDKNIKMKLREETVKELDPNPVAKTKPQKIATGLEAETGAVETNRETKTTGGTETGAGTAAGVETVGVKAKGTQRGEIRPAVEPIETEAQTEVRRETLTEAGALEARVRKGKPAKTAPLIEKIKSESLGTTEDDAVAAAALTATERKKRAVRALIVNPKAKGAQKSKSQTALEAEIIIKGIVLLAQALTVTDVALSH